MFLPSISSLVSNLSRGFHLVPLPTAIHASIFGFFYKLPNFFGAMDCSTCIFCFISNIHLGVSTHHVCLCGSGLFHSAWFSSSYIHLPENFMMPLFFCFVFYNHWVILHCVYTLCVYHIFFIYSSVKGHLGCFQVLAIMNNAAMNVVEQVSLWYG